MSLTNTSTTLDDVQRWLRCGGLSTHDPRIATALASCEGYEQQAMELQSALGGSRRLTRSAMKKIGADRDVAQRMAEYLSSLRSPVRRLPPELLGVVFSFCLPRHDDFLVPCPHYAPLLLAQVCGLWREAALSMPSLWATFEFVGHPETTMTPEDFDKESWLENQFRLLDLWLQRSGAYPFSLSIREAEADCPLSRVILQQHLGRLANLRLFLPQKGPSLLTLPDEDEYPLLRSLQIHSAGGLRPGSVKALSKSIARIPNLRSFFWNNVVNHRDWGVLKLPWNRLTRLMLNSCISTGELLSILSEANNMTHATFQDVCSSSGNGIFNYPSSIHLPNLVSFVLCTAVPLAPIFSCLTFPNLSEVVINLHHQWDHNSFMEFIRRSKCPLQSLNLYFSNISEAQLIELLRTVQSTLTELTVQSSSVDRVCVTDQLFEKMTYIADGPLPLCPKVEVIAFYECIACSPGRFASMAQSRVGLNGERDKVEGLKVLELYCTESEIAHLTPLKSEGLLLKIYDSEGNAVEMDEEDTRRLRKLREEGLVLRVYTASTGFFGEADYPPF